MDLFGPINPPSHGHILTKWVEAIPFRKAAGSTVANLIKESIICRFGILEVILLDNGTLFINKHVGQLLNLYDITHHKLTPYYPQGKDQVEATNKMLLKILSRTLRAREVNENRWSGWPYIPKG